MGTNADSDQGQDFTGQGSPQEVVLSRDAMLGELLDWCNRFITESSNWRRSSFESQWQRWQRAADAIYDPELASKKEKWQAKFVVPISASHRENAQAQLFKTEIGPNPPLEFVHRTQKPRAAIPGMPPPVNQGELIRDCVLWEREKARYAIERNKVLEDKTTYGDGFCRARFETRIEDREVEVPDFEEPSVFNPPSIIRSMMGQPLQIGSHKEIKPTVVYRGLVIEHISIWDIFPDPKALKIKGNAIAHRYNQTYGEIVRGVEEGYYIPECLEPLRDLPSEDVTPTDKRMVESDRQISESSISRTKYQSNRICFELQARLPAKWVYLDGQPMTDPEKLVPARVRFHQNSVISVQLQDTYDGEPDIYQDKYMPVAGQFYSRGIPEMLKDVQMIATETVCQRLDAGSIMLDPMFAIFSKFVEDPKDLEQSRAGGFVRLKVPVGSNIEDVGKVFARIDKGNIDRAAFVEPQEWERYGQQRTSITETQLGTEDNRDTTLGAQQIQQGVTGTKLTYLGMLSEYGFQEELTHAIVALIYKNYGPEDYMMALGPEKASQMEVMTPEQVALNFRIVPKGIFEMEKKGQRQAQIAALTQQFGMAPWFNVLGAAKAQIAAVDQDESIFILPEADAIQITTKAQQMAQGMAQQLVDQRDQEELAAKAEKGAKMEAE